MKAVKYFLIALAATLAGLGIYHFIRSRKIEKNALAEGEQFEDSEPCGCCGAEFSETQKKEMPAEEPIAKEDPIAV